MISLKVSNRKVLGLLLVGILIPFISFIWSENKPVVVSNNKAEVVFFLKGGIFKSFNFIDNSFNPLGLNANLPEEESNAVSNINNNGCNKILWELSYSPIKIRNQIEMMMKAEMLEERVTYKRYISLPENSALVKVQEEIYNYGNKSSSFDFSQKIPLLKDFVNNVSIFTNLKGEFPKGIKVTQIGIDNSSFGIIILLNQEKEFFLAYLFNKSDFSTIKFINKDIPQIQITGDNNVSVPVLGRVTKSYITFIGKAGKELKDFNNIKILENTITLEANNGKVKFDYQIPKGKEF